MENVMKTFSEFMIVVCKDKKGRITYTNTEDSYFHNIDNLENFSYKNKYYHRKITKQEKTVTYCYIDITEYVKDFLTGCLNRVGFDIWVNEKKQDDIFILALCDIDDFKKVNDKYGHVCGDYILKELGNLFLKEAGKNSVVSRYGGEEFIIALPKDSIHKLEKIRKKIEKTSFLLDGHEMYITITIGICEIGEIDTIDSVVSRADDSMYKGKKLGKNKIIYEEK